MEKRIELEKRGRSANQIKELNLDNCRSTNIVGLTDDFTALEALSLINVGLTTLKGYPKLPSLKRLELSDNRISSGLSNLNTSPKLTHLNLSGNKIKEMEELRPLETFKSLCVLDLFNNQVTSIDNYRGKIFALIPSLVYLDGFDAKDKEALSEDDEDYPDSDEEEEEEEEASLEIGDEYGGDDAGGDEDYDEDEDEDLSLAEVYNDDLEEDNSDYVEEGDDGDAEEEDDVDSDEEDGAVAPAAADANDTEPTAADANDTAPEQPGEEESPARGKKRKHDG